MDMVEKVARAICISEGHDPDHDNDPERLGLSLDIRWMNYVPQALSALEAMREPDHDMTGAVLRPGEDRTFLVSLWQGMIDAALGQHTEQPLPLPDRR